MVQIKVGPEVADESGRGHQDQSEHGIGRDLCAEQKPRITSAAHRTIFRPNRIATALSFRYPAAISSRLASAASCGEVGMFLPISSIMFTAKWGCSCGS